MADQFYGKDNYDPYEHRNVVSPISNFGALMNVIKSIVGTGILAAPMAFHNAGWLNALISSAMIGIIVLYSKQILMCGLYEVAKRRRVPIFSYADGLVEAIAEGPPFMHGLQKILRGSVNTLLFIYHFGSCCVYVVFIANCIKDFGDHYWAVWDSRIYMCCEILPLCLIYCVPNLRSLVPYAMAANFSLVIGFGIIFYYMFSNLQPIEELQQFQDFRLYPLFFGATLFALEGAGLIVSIEAKMKTPKSYVGITGVLSRSIFIVILLQLTFGFFGYWRYGDGIKSAILQSLPYDEILANIARVIFAFSMYITHPLQAYVSIEVMWDNWLKDKVAEKRAFALELVFRMCLAVGSVIFAIILPNLTLIISFVGAFCLSFLGLIFPALIDISIRYKTDYGPAKIYLILSVLVIAFGIIGGATGSFVPIEQMIKLYIDGTDLAG
ncbi:proton-coupled amino acid transporter-like protein CG1139 [Rhagoletis pomonella]|uniref:proton-coupled amino acid transporter-like protein CG1139 n=1 Tax=Rhagoletis pomonella TaxID=28610 RepID=UPI00178152A9|nr:proton-coupled amino acid transporter-like protein CG1139 [Rhagoletis pomonella]XP_036334126.1 proton-coupled amino acid transporter-like protein CG1139 [Rhagoletis pomonella]